MGLAAGLIPDHAVDERTMLLDYLDRQRQLVFWKLDGLSDDAARSVSSPTGLSIHNLVRHLENVERGWIREHFANEPDLVFTWADIELGQTSEQSLVDLLAAYRAEIVLCDAVVAGAGLEDTSRQGPQSLRWVLLHLVEELSRHMGHLDLLAELADGRTGEEPSGAASMIY